MDDSRDITARVTVHKRIIDQQLDSILISNRVLVGCHEVYIHFEPVSNLRYKRDFVMLCYFIKVEVECEFSVCYKAFKAYVALQYGLNMFKKLRETDRVDAMLQEENAYLLKNIPNTSSKSQDPLAPARLSTRLQGDDAQTAQSLLTELKPCDVDVVTEEFGTLSLPSCDDVDDFLTTLRHGPIHKGKSVLKTAENKKIVKNAKRKK